MTSGSVAVVASLWVPRAGRWGWVTQPIATPAGVARRAGTTSAAVRLAAAGLRERYPGGDQCPGDLEREHRDVVA